MGVLGGPKPPRTQTPLERPQGPGGLTGTEKPGTGGPISHQNAPISAIVRGPTGTPKRQAAHIRMEDGSVIDVFDDDILDVRASVQEAVHPSEKNVRSSSELQLCRVAVIVVIPAPLAFSDAGSTYYTI